jgi:hypothetical protein
MADMTGKQIHFVVTYDVDSDTYEMDYDSLMAKFHDQPIYNTKTDEWETLTHDQWEFDWTVYNRSGDALADVVHNLKAKDLFLYLETN